MHTHTHTPTHVRTHTHAHTHTHTHTHTRAHTHSSILYYVKALNFTVNAATVSSNVQNPSS